MIDDGDLLSGVPGATGPAGSESATTVAVALAANLVIALAKSVAAMLTGSASILAEAAHSWADTGNEVFLVIANRRSARTPDQHHPLGHGREAYVWSLFAALGLFVAGAAVSITHGVQELFASEPASDFVVGYVVLAVSFLLEATSFLQSVRQARPEAAALIGLVLAGGGLALHQLTGSPVPDAVGSILVGLLLGVVALVLINRNRRFLVGEEADPRARSATIQALLQSPEVSRVTYLRLEVVGPRMVSVIGDVDLTGNDEESHLAVRLRALEARLTASPAVAGAVLSLSAPDEPTLEP